MTEAETKLLREQGPFASGVLPTRPVIRLDVVDRGPCVWCGGLSQCTPECMERRAELANIVSSALRFLLGGQSLQQYGRREEDN